MTLESLALTASLVCCAVFYAAAAAIFVIRRPLVPPSLPATSDLGSETPAVANLLVSRSGTVTPDAVPATLFDLAACRVVEIDETEPHNYSCRIGPEPPGGLTAYEARVLDLLRRKAAGGTVPAAALTTGPTDQARRWHRSFARDVVNEARRAGLCQPRWPPQVLTALGVPVVVAVWIAGFVANDETKSHKTDLFLGIAIGVVFLSVWVLGRITQDATQLVTRAGLPAQARWLALRKYLHDDELFASLPPTAVAVRERYLAYGAALGVAAAAVRAIPMGAENDRRAWSQYGGRWRQVTVSYPTLWPPAWGDSPAEAMWRGLKVGLFGSLVLWVSSLVLPHIEFGPRADQLTRDLSAGAVVAAALSLVLIGAGLWLVLAGLVSLFGTQHVTGAAIRLRQFSRRDATACYLAVDDGTRDHVRAWKVRPVIYDPLVEYSTVSVVVTPLLRFVREVNPAAAPATTARAAAQP